MNHGGTMSGMSPFDYVDYGEVQVSRELPVQIGKHIVGVDKELVRLVKAINKFPGIRTIECCSGHGLEVVGIWFVPDSIEALPLLLYCFDSCHTGVNTWPVSIYTDCSADHVTWVVESQTRGEEAYKEADKIASVMENVLAEKERPV
jgi:hypothetical protein